MGLDRPITALQDVAGLLLVLAGVATLSTVTGVASFDTLRFTAVFAAFLLPGWVAGARCLSPAERSDPISRLCITLLISYLAYAVVALGCRAAGLGFGAFAVGYAGFSVIALAWGWPAVSGARERSVRSRWREHACVVLAAVLAAGLYGYPLSVDLIFFEFNTLASLETRSFAPSTVDVRPFGVETPQPRMQANLAHSAFSLLGFTAGVSPRLLLYTIAPAFLGLFLLLALTAFVREFGGRRVDPFIAFVSAIAPFTLLHNAHHAYWYEGRIVNNPGTDKDFSGWFLVPLLLIVASRALQGQRHALWILGIGGLVIGWTHPLGPTYLFISCGVLVVATLSREGLGRAAATLVISGITLAICTFAINAAETQTYLQELLRHDLASGGPRYWLGHYTQQGNHTYSGIDYCCGSRAVVSEKHFFGSSLVRYSVPLAIAWALAFGWRQWRERKARGSGEIAAGALLLTSSVAAVCLHPAPPTLTLLFASGIAGAAGAGLVAASAWREEGPSDEAARATDLAQERRAVRLQAAYLAVLLGMYAGAAWLLSYSSDMAGGLARLSWLYLGFFPFAFAFVYGLDALRSIGRRLLPRRHAVVDTTIGVLPALLVTLHVADQTNALVRAEPTLLSRHGIAASFADEARDLREIVGLMAKQVSAAESERGSDTPLASPTWLRSEDRVLVDRTAMLVSLEGRYQLMKRAVFYREPFAEAFALQHRGDAFLTESAAFNDFQAGRVTNRLIDWLLEREVSLIIVKKGSSGLMKRLRNRLPFPVAKIGQASEQAGFGRVFDVYRLYTR